MKLKRLISVLLLLAMLLSCLPFSALAVETGTPDVGDVPTSEITGIMDVDSPAEPVTLALDADTAGEHYFYLSAQTTSTSQQLLIRPTKVYYDEGDSIAQALLQSGYSFADLDEQYSKFISKIQNVDGNFTYCGDFPEAVTLLEQASSIHYLYFSESTNAQMTSALQRLMQVAADYLDKPTDVQAAAKAVYDEVLAQYPGQTEEETAALAAKLSSAIQSYEDSLTSDPYSVAVEVLEACTITAVNEYGREFPASGSTLRLPAGTYTIEARADNRVASRKNVAVPDRLRARRPRRVGERPVVGVVRKAEENFLRRHLGQREFDDPPYRGQRRHRHRRAVGVAPFIRHKQHSIGIGGDGGVVVALVERSGLFA